MRIGILGTGFGKRHGEIWSSFPDVEVMGIVGRDEHKTEAVARQLGVAGYTDPGRLIDDPGVDAIDVCTPTSVHAEYVTAALEQGKHVFCETPVAYTLAEAERMAQAAASSGKLLLVALFGRFVSDYRAIHGYVEAGRLGRPRAVFANRRTPPVWGGGWDEHFIANLMLHDIDYVTWLLGEPSAVTGRALAGPETGWEHVTVALEYDDASGVVEGCGIMPASFPFSTSLRIVCEAGAIDLDWRWGGDAPISQVKLYPEESEPEILPVAGYDPYEAECRYFADCVQGKTDPEMLSIDTACVSLRVALAAKTSLLQGGARIAL